MSFKDIWGCSFSEAYAQLAFNISSLCVEHAYLLDSGKVNGADKKSFARLMDRRAEEVEVRNSLYMLTRMLYMHFGRQVILLLDEYDVPLGKAHENGYYTKMLDVVKGVMSSAFKTTLL